MENTKDKVETKNGKALIIGVAGGTGSGKTTLAKKLFDAFSPDVCMLSHDYYYKDNHNMPFEERKKLNYDHPNSLDTDMMIEDIKKLSMGVPIMHPTYNFETHLRAEFVPMEPKKIIIVEGILLFENKALADLLDVKIFVDTDADVRFIRRLKRDVNKRGRSMESVITQYLTTVKPMHEQFVEPSKRIADIIVPEGGHNVVAVNMIVDAIRRRFEDIV